MRLALGLITVIAGSAWAFANETEQGIRADCASEWGANYRMQEHCINRQIEAYGEMRQGVYSANRNADEDLILYNCLGDWKTSHGYNWRMVQHCYTRQHEAYTRLKGSSD